MKNLKRILSLALAGTMLVGMMMVGASAASFTDADKVEHKEAAETLAALGVMVGAAQPDGTTVFNPEGKLDRAAMAKMIAVIMNKGKDPTFADTDTPSFTDVKAGAWYVPYVEYCANLGYVSGYGNGVFGPNDELTATQAARMILNAMGYKWDGQGDWKLATEVQARDEGLDLYNGLDEIIPSQIMTRDNAAQMLYNALTKPLANANVTEETYYLLTSKDGKTTETFSSVVDASTYADVAKWEEGYTIEKMSTKVTETLVGKYLNTKTAPGVTVSGITYDSKTKTYTLGSYTTSVDLTQYMGQKVKILYKDNAKKTVLGIVPEGKVLTTGVAGDITKDDAKNKVLTIAGTKYEYTSNKITTWNSAAEATPNDWDELTVIDNDGDGKIDAMVSRPVTVVKVTNVGKTSIVAGKTYTFKDNDIEDGLKNGDWVTIVDNDPYAGSAIAKVAVIENVQATAKSKDDVYTIGGNSYWSATDADELSAVVLGKNYNLVAINGAVFSAVEYKDGTTATAGVDKLVYATRAVAPVAGKDDMGGSTKTETQQVELLFTDGTKKIVTVTKVDDTPVKKGEKHDAESDTCSDCVHANADTLYTYALDKKGNYELTAAPTDELGDLDANGTLTSTKLAGGKFGTTFINDDAILFVQLTNKDGETEVKVLTGAEVAKWNTVTDNLAGGVIYTESKNGFAYTVAGMIILPTANKTWPGSVSATKYGYITADAEEVYNAELKDTYAQVVIWNGTENVTRLYKLGDGEALTDFTAGTMVSYTEGDKALETLADLGAAADAVIGYAGGEEIILNTDKSVTTLKDAVIIFVNDAKKEGVAASEATIQRAAEHAEVSGLLINNVYVAKDGDQVVLFVDSENKIADQTKVLTVTNEIKYAGVEGKNRAYTVTMNPANGKVAKADGAKVTLTITQGAEVDGHTDTVTIGEETLSFTDGKCEKDISVTTEDVKVTITVTTAAAETTD